MCKNLYSIDTVYNLVLNSTQLIWTPCTDTHTGPAFEFITKLPNFRQTVIPNHCTLTHTSPIQTELCAVKINYDGSLSKERVYVPCAFVSSSRASDHTVSIHSYYKCMECYTKYQLLHCFTKYAFYNY